MIPDVMSEGAKSVSTTARGRAVTTVTNSLSGAHSSPGLALIADPFPSSTLTCLDPSASVARPPQFIPTRASSHSEHYQPNFYILEEQKPASYKAQGTKLTGSSALEPPQQTVLDKISKPQTTTVPRHRDNSTLIRQLLLKNINPTALLQLKTQQQQVSSQNQGRLLSSPSQNIVQQELPSQQAIVKLQQQENIRKQLQLLQHKLEVKQQQRVFQQQHQHQQLLIGVNQGGQQTASSQTRIVDQPTSQKGLAHESGVTTLSPMTAGILEAKDRPMDSSETMESRLCADLQPFVNTCGDLPLSTDFIDASIYASSPNSLHIYEQEKIDMQCTMGASTSCTSLDAGSAGDDFELKTQYEVSQDISSFPVGFVSSSNKSSDPTMIQGTCDLSTWSDNLKPGSQDVYIKTESQDVSTTPTLAELNLNLLDDIESYINFEMNVNTGTSAPGTEVIVKQEPGIMIEKQRSIDLMGQAGGSSSRILTATGVQYTPVHASSTVVKTEPVEMNVSHGSEYQKSFSPMTAVKPELIVPRGVAESRAPLTTIKEIDISDFTTLQKLLKTQPLQARGGRKRAVSESQVGVKASSLKRSVAAAGLDSMELKWEEIKQFLERDLDMQEKPAAPYVKRERTRYDSTSSVMTLTSNEDDDSDSDKDFDDDSDSDLEGGHDIGSLSPSESLIGTKEKQYFWQYNVQSKGPKGTRVKFEMEEDPHVLNDFEDPVFGSTSPEKLSGIGVSIKHGGKARKGDGNDIVPSPKKLCQIGLQLRKINRQINDFVPVSELPSQAKSKSRKEKNKLASRACRLKKKAQHEANKIKLHGLETEHRRLLTVIHLIRQKLYDRLRKKQTDRPSMSDTLEVLVKENLGEMIAGHTTDFVNSVIHKVEAGDLKGGILVHATRSYPKELHN